MPRDPRWVNWPFDYGWIWWPSGDGGKAGHVRIGHLDTNRWWEVPIRDWDAIAQRHMADRTVKPGHPIRMPDGKMLEVRYQDLDDEADNFVRRGMQPNMDRSPVNIRARDGTQINGMHGMPRDFFEALALQHVQRRKQDGVVPLRLGKDTLNIGYENFDAIVKDFVRNQRDRFVAAGRWPELLIHEGVAQDPRKQGPLPVQGRPDAFGQGATPGLNPQKPGQPGGPSGPVGHPAIENQELV